MIESPKSPFRRGRLAQLNNSFISDNLDDEEEKLIEVTLTTTYEKVLTILFGIKDHLEQQETSKEYVNELKWVIERIKSHSLYTYDLDQAIDNNDKITQGSPEIQSIFNFINDFSEKKIFERRPKQPISKTVKQPVCKEIVMKLNERVNRSFLGKKVEFDSISLISMNSNVINNEDETGGKILDALKLSNLSIKEDDIMDPHFDIFKFEEKLGRENLFAIVSKKIFSTFEFNPPLNLIKVNNFLNDVKVNYSPYVPYHNEMHGLDVCQTVSWWIIKSDLVTQAELSDIDLLSMLFSAITHDVGHPGYNNNYQINALTDFALTYNDRSVLENHHTSLAFKILLKQSNNFTENYSLNDFKIFRKRAIEAILSTDMVQHARIVSSMKNKVLNYNFEKTKNPDLKFISDNSKTLYEDQQELINFIIHTADLSHNSKPFHISKNWVDRLMKEFWSQGDEERTKGLPISFLCDRNTADVPGGQVGFIKGIIIPNFETLIDILPQLGYLMDTVYNNLNEWNNLVDENNEKSGSTSPRNRRKSPRKELKI